MNILYNYLLDKIFHSSYLTLVNLWLQRSSEIFDLLKGRTLHKVTLQLIEMNKQKVFILYGCLCVNVNIFSFNFWASRYLCTWTNWIKIQQHPNPLNTFESKHIYKQCIAWRWLNMRHLYLFLSRLKTASFSVLQFATHIQMGIFSCRGSSNTK